MEQIEQIAIQHDPRLYVDCTRVYHFGARYNVEMEIVLPGVMTVMESHDIALALQHKIESLEDVERAFVHVSMYSDDDALSVTCSLLAPYLPTFPRPWAHVRTTGGPRKARRAGAQGREGAGQLVDVIILPR